MSFKIQETATLAIVIANSCPSDLFAIAGRQALAKAEAIPDFEIASAQLHPRNDSVFNIEHQTSNIKPQTSNPKHQTSNIKPQTRL